MQKTLPKTSETLNEFKARVFPPSERVYNLRAGAMGLMLALSERPFIMVEGREELGRRLFEDVKFFRKLLAGGEVLHLPAPEGPESIGRRALVFSKFLSTGDVSIITSLESARPPLWEGPLETIEIKKGQKREREELITALDGLGYVNTALVTGPGEYSRRQWILDVFPAHMPNPVRVEFFGDEIESVRAFDIETQSSSAELESFDVYPASAPETGPGLLELDIKRFGLYGSEALIEELPEGTCFLTGFAISGSGTDAGLIPMRGLGIMPGERRDIYELPDALRPLSAHNRIIIVSPSMPQAERLRDVFRERETPVPVLEASEIISYEGSIAITVGGLTQGFYLPGLMMLTDSEILRSPEYRPMKRSRVSGLLRSLEDIEYGDFVVHKDYGIGIFRGLERQGIEGREFELVAVEYGGGDKIFLPPERIGLIHKYHAGEGSVPKVERLGSRSWQKTRARAKKKVDEMAGKLLNIYAEREVAKGHAFGGETELHREFDGFFPYEETPDQIKAVEEIKADMESPRPMDRLLSGDVGYGKTEVAMRAAFKAAFDGKQVAVIVPTTLLCEQHFRNFKTRFSAFPVRIDYISRFKPPARRKAALESLQKGEIDIIIGTHGLLRRNIEFQDLGLLIIDEEHRFGVGQKERIKELRKGIDVLTLSATPIPRTLQMALSGLRGLSTITTPPEERLAVKTTVAAYSDALIKEAVERELNREGQVFFVHNRIRDIDKIAGGLRALFPDVRIEAAHGRMPERILEDIMFRFLNRESDILVSTSIIGSGIDIPNANTIIINRADTMGLADLYQLRGRVGRSEKKAYAYFLIPPRTPITEDALKRIEALEELSYLGAGLRLALKDLEIRGAGNILGSEQSGFIGALGFDLFMEMLERAIAEQRGEPIRDEDEAELDLKADAFIPEDYIPDMMLRLTLYRRIALAKTENALGGILSETRDRFGPVPEPVGNLLRAMKLRIRASGLGIKSIKQSGIRLGLKFSKQPELEAGAIIEALGRRVRFTGDGLEITMTKGPFEEADEALGIIERATVSGR